MTESAILVLEDGSVFRGYSFGAPISSVGEIVFNTSMTGYQEVLTDPSYAGQIVVMTYPLIGNYGINKEDFESKGIQVSGFAVREHCEYPSHYQSTSSIGEFLAQRGVPGISGIDTRALTRKLRTQGVMMGTIATGASAEESLSLLKSQPNYGNVDYVRKVSTPDLYSWETQKGSAPPSGNCPKIVVIDSGLKYNILRILSSKGCSVTALPVTASPEEIASLNPDGILLSPGPGDPVLLDYLVDTVKVFMESKPIMGICLGQQVLARAFGGVTYKLKFGHRGANHPVKDLINGRVHITSQNHGYSVDAGSLPSELEVTHLSLNDGTVEGMRHRELPIMSIQYHSEASPGPRDNMYLFDRWLEMVRKKEV